MRHSLRVVLSVAALALVYRSDAGKGPNVLQREAPDAFEVFAAFPYAVGISDINNDTIFECLSARRKDFDPEAKTVTYVWSLNDGPGKRKRVAFHHTAGATPDATNFTVGKSTDVEVAYIVWSDYKDCAITDVSHFSQQCTLWVSKAVEDLVPVSCLEQFHDVCGVMVPLRDSDLCLDDENDVDDDDNGN
ncbi:uncharacterized protein LOC119397314 [Rhipicephalus sanguineus]|uniref:uncharacterized protein LOC119397314 n=1 Tax=Rhipicephalus sanguineus TaxID=34632 RepID=UPI001893C96A|nr:uncharacterized protein LOC119397314 [Rhipicephalus sanguineus]